MPDGGRRRGWGQTNDNHIRTTNWANVVARLVALAGRFMWSCEHDAETMNNAFLFIYVSSGITKQRAEYTLTRSPFGKDTLKFIDGGG